MSPLPTIAKPRLLRPIAFPYFMETESESVARRKKYSQSEVLFRLGVISSTIFMTVLALFFYFYIFSLNNQINYLERQINNFRKSNNLEQIQVARLSNLDRLYQIATQDLGLSKPEKVEYIYLE